MMTLGSVTGLFRYPVKSMQGIGVTSLDVLAEGVVDDRGWALIDVTTGRLMSAKRYSALLQASADDAGVTLPDGTRVDWGDPYGDRTLSRWLGREVRLEAPRPEVRVAYEMTFEPPNDGAEYIDIDAPAGSFRDLAPIHLVTQQTLDGCVQRRPDLDWDVRRFRPNLLIDAPDIEPFGEDDWTGSRIRVGEVTLSIIQPSVRCAMPLRAQPGLERQAGLYQALEDLHANHLGVYVDVVEPGRIALGDGLTTD